MCGRYVIVKNLVRIEKQFGLKLSIDNPDQYKDWASNYNVSAADLAPIITSKNPRTLTMGSFGFSPVWSDKRKCILNARSEGKSNPSNDPLYSGGMGIIQSKMWGVAIRNKRCVVIADAFIEGPEKEKLSKPHIVYVINEKPIALAGIYSEWVSRETGEITITFAVLTHVANKICQQIGHHRSPVIIEKEDINTWLDTNSTLSDIVPMLKPCTRPMNAYPVDPELIRSGSMKDRGVIEPVGQRLLKEMTMKMERGIELQGMGETTARKRKQEQEK